MGETLLSGALGAIATLVVGGIAAWFHRKSLLVNFAAYPQCYTD